MEQEKPKQIKSLNGREYLKMSNSDVTRKTSILKGHYLAHIRKFLSTVRYSLPTIIDPNSSVSLATSDTLRRK
jgi:hypothetical protein